MKRKAAVGVCCRRSLSRLMSSGSAVVLLALIIILFTGKTASGIVCGSGETNCSGVCVNLQTNGLNCGACANGCGPAVRPACCYGECTDLWGDPDNCGACGNECGDECIGGRCECPVSAVEFELGMRNCGGNCTYINIDVNNCGSCGFKCASGNCVGGICQCSGPSSKECGNCGTETRTCNSYGTWSG